MYVVIATLRIKPERREDFLAALLDDARVSIEIEPGVYRFDVTADEADPNRLHLYEVYEDQAAHQRHKETPHFLRWRDTVADWYAEPLRVSRGHSIFPSLAAWRRQGNA
ncbi:MAG: antibiotic biosynthesis monooxygenase [Chloroflexi bacterium]|nr:antibiotic biosynthesis monooxygenase [Chloroflexota bacterium]